MEITTDPQIWLWPRRVRAAGQIIRRAHIGFMMNPIIRPGEDIWHGDAFVSRRPDKLVGWDLAVAGPDLPDGRLELWFDTASWGHPVDGYPFVYFVFEDATWNGSNGGAGHAGGWLYVKTIRQGWAEYLKHRAEKNGSAPK